MASLESTAYPQFLSFYSTEDLKQFFTVEAEDLARSRLKCNTPIW